MPRGVVDLEGLKSTPVRKLMEARPAAGLPFDIRKLGHAVLKVRDLERSVEFYTRVLGFKVSDVYPESMMAGGMAFLRANTDHHCLALIGGGAVPYHWGRYRGLAQDMGRPPIRDLLLENVFFDTCVYHRPGIELLLKVIPADNILFASEMVGAVRGVDPESGHHYDDTKRYIDSIEWLASGDREKIFFGNAGKVYPRFKPPRARG